MASIGFTLTLNDLMTSNLTKIGNQSKNTEKAFEGINESLDQMDAKSKKASSSVNSIFKNTSIKSPFENITTPNIEVPKQLEGPEIQGRINIPTEDLERFSQELNKVSNISVDKNISSDLNKIGNNTITTNNKINKLKQTSDKFANTSIDKNISSDLNKIGQGIDNTSKSIKNLSDISKKASSSVGSIFKGMLGANLVTGAISKVFNLVNSGLDGAIKRFDTLNNYTKVMDNLGISEQDAEKSRERLSKGLKGLPTTLDSAVSAVQRLTSSNNDIEASTEMYLALNNALLAGGASTEVQASAMEQLAQAYAKGKPDMMEWRALQTAMPGQLQQIAKAMGKTTTQLGEDLRTGKTSMNDFMKTIVKLNEEGTDGFASFEEQAKKSTGGIQTAIANMKSAISRGWTEMFEGANQALEASGLPNLSQIITNLGTALEDLMNHIGTDLLPSIGDGLSTLAGQVQDFTSSLNVEANKSVGIFDYFMLGFNYAKQGFLFGLAMIQTGALSVAIVVVKGFTALTKGINTALSVATHIVQDGVNIMINCMNQLITLFNKGAEGFNNYFGWMGMHANQIELVAPKNFAEDFDNRSTITGDTLDKLVSDMEKKNQEIMDKTSDWNNKSVDKLLDDTYNRLYSNTDKATNGNNQDNQALKPYDYNKIDKLVNNAINNTTTSTGNGKAVKTKNTDDLLSDDDIQLLLDVATRDYKLNYQQVTPNITLTFGDIRESVDVDDVLDEVADKLQEIYDGNLGVGTI